jgi:hypothetical protein
MGTLVGRLQRQLVGLWLDPNPQPSTRGASHTNSTAQVLDRHTPRQPNSSTFLEKSASRFTTTSGRPCRSSFSPTSPSYGSKHATTAHQMIIPTSRLSPPDLQATNCCSSRDFKRSTAKALCVLITPARTPAPGSQPTCSPYWASTR